MQSLDPSFTVLYVANPAASAAFYRDLLGLETASVSEGFAAIPLPGGRLFGLWRADAVQPQPVAPSGGFEFGVMIAGEGGVAAAFERVKAAGHAILQPLTAMEFGPTFVVADPDGHRIRFCEPDT